MKSRMVPTHPPRRLATAHPGTPGDLLPGIDLEPFTPLIRLLGLLFVSADLALRADGTWRVVELGDGQVSDRPATTWAKVPYKEKCKPEPQKEANRAHAKLQAPGERANAQLKLWKILTKLRCCPRRAGKLAKARHVLQLREA